MMVVYVVNQAFVKIIHALHNNRSSYVMHKKPVQEMGYAIPIRSCDYADR